MLPEERPKMPLSPDTRPFSSYTATNLKFVAQLEAVSVGQTVSDANLPSKEVPSWYC